MKSVYITSITPIETLVERGIVPEWIARDAIRHGMSEAENLLCEWDWEYGWDLGYGYTSQQLEVLKEVRKAIEEGIKAFESNPELKAIEKARRAVEKHRREGIPKLKKFFQGYVSQYECDWLYDYERKHGEWPLLHFVCYRMVNGPKTEKQEILLALNGISRDEIPTNEELAAMFPEVDGKTLKRLEKGHWTLLQKFGEMARSIDEKLPNPLPDANDAYWNEVIERERLAEFNMSIPQIMRLVELLRYSLKKSTWEPSPKYELKPY